jgi:hypothetical protein
MRMRAKASGVGADHALVWYFIPSPYPSSGMYSDVRLYSAMYKRTQEDKSHGSAVYASKAPKNLQGSAPGTHWPKI